MRLLTIFKAVFYLSLSYFSYLMILITLQYVPIDFNVAFLNIKQDELAYVHYQWAFFIHVYTSIFVLLAGITQFSNSIRVRFSKMHRYLGYVYITLVLLVASPSGLVMAVHANGGLVTKISFILQAVLWFWFTYKAYKFALAQSWDNHRKFMLRSYALTLSAISLRLIKWVIIAIWALPPMDTYKIVAWMGWLVNIVVVEVYLALKK